MTFATASATDDLTIEQMLISAPDLAVQYEALSMARGQRYANTWLADLVDLAARGIEPGVERRHLRNWASDAIDAFRGKKAGKREAKLAYSVN